MRDDRPRGFTALAAPAPEPNINVVPRLRSIDNMVNHVCEPIHSSWFAFCGSDGVLQGGRATSRNPAYLQPRALGEGPVAAMLKAIRASEDIAAAQDKALQVIEEAAGFTLNLTRAPNRWQRRPRRRSLSYYGFPVEDWAAHRYHNPLERILPEIRRCTRWLTLFRMADRPATWPRRGCGTSPAPLGRARDA
jgi:hypothetical protein